MRILLIHNYYHYKGGEDTYVNSLSALLYKKGHSVYLYSKKNQNEIGLIKNIGIYLGLFYNPDIDNELREILLIFKPDIVHIHNLFYLISFHILAVIKKYNIPIVLTIQNYRLLCPGAFLIRKGKPCIHATKGNWIKKLFSSCYQESLVKSFLLVVFQYYIKAAKLLNSVDKFIFVSETIKIKHEVLLSDQNKKITILPNFSMVADCQNQKKSNKERYFLFVGRFSPEKGIIDLLEIAKKNKQINFIFIGEGPLKSLIEMSVDDNTIIKNSMKRDEILLYMRNAISLIIPSKWTEAFPFVGIEAFSVGTPIIVPNYGSFKEFVKDGKNGFFYKYNDKNSLEKKILSIWNRKNIDTERKQAFYTYINNYTEGIHYKKLIKLYSETIHASHFRSLNSK